MTVTRCVGGEMKAALVSLVIFAVVVGCGAPTPTPSGPATNSAVATVPGSASPSASAGPDAIFPKQVAGSSVVTVTHAKALLDAGELDGQAVAVAGYYESFTPSCPPPGRYIAPLQQWCGLAALSDTRAGAQLCAPAGSEGGASCQWPTAAYFRLVFVTETSGYPGGADQDPIPLVVIGHSGDPRQWQCLMPTQDGCSRAFVVDRVAWAAGKDVPVTPAPTISQPGEPQVDAMTLGQVIASTGLDANTIVAAAALPASEVGSIDPRWNRVGKNLLWVVRSLGAAATPQALTRPETVWLIDDKTGKVLDSQPMALPGDYQPGRLWLEATLHGTECCDNKIAAFSRVEADGGTTVSLGVLSGGSGGPGYTTYGGGYGSLPIVLVAGTYRVTTWLGPYNGDVTRPSAVSCSTKVSVGASEIAAVNADFPHAKSPCTFKAAPPPPHL